MDGKPSTLGTGEFSSLGSGHYILGSRLVDPLAFSHALGTSSLGTSNGRSWTPHTCQNLSVGDPKGNQRETKGNHSGDLWNRRDPMWLPSFYIMDMVGLL